MDYTAHAVMRFAERFPELIEKGVSPRVALHRAFQGATIDRGFMNNTARIVWMLEKYGDFNYDYYLKDKIVFLTKNDVVITVLNRHDSGMLKLFGPASQPRYRKKTKCLA